MIRFLCVHMCACIKFCNLFVKFVMSPDNSIESCGFLVSVGLWNDH